MESGTVNGAYPFRWDWDLDGFLSLAPTPRNHTVEQQEILNTERDAR